MNNNTFAGNAAPAPTITSQPNPIQDGIPPQPSPKKPKTGLIIGIIIAILAIVIGAIVLIIVIGNNSADKDKKEGNSSANSNEGNNENNKSKKSDEKLVLGAEGKTITIKNDLEATVKSFVEAGFNVEYTGAGARYNIESVYLKDKDLDVFFSSTSIPMDGVPFFCIGYEGYKLISISGVIPNYDVDKKDAKVALSEFELAQVEVTYPGSGDYSFNGKNLNVQKSSYDDIKKAFGREADKVSEIKPTSNVQYTYTEGAFDVIITANEKEIRFLSVQPIRE